MQQIYILPTCVAVIVSVTLMLWAGRNGYGLLARALAGAGAGAVSWYVTLFATVVIMIPAGAHG